MASKVCHNDSKTAKKAAVPILPALGGKLNNTIATLRSLRSLRFKATILLTRAANMMARSGQECMSCALVLSPKVQAW